MYLALFLVKAKHWNLSPKFDSARDVKRLNGEGIAISPGMIDQRTSKFDPPWVTELSTNSCEFGKKIK